MVRNSKSKLLQCFAIRPYIRRGYTELELMLARTSLFLSNRSQAVRLPKAVAFAEEVREVVIVPDGPRRIIAPADAAWDDFFDAPGVDLGARQQPAMRERERF